MTSAPQTIPAPPRPGAKSPELTVPLVGGGTWSLRDQSPRNFTMLAFYRGLHCPACRGQLRELQERFKELQGLGVDPIAISADSRDRSERARADWGLTDLPVGYDLPVAAMREWGLFVSEAANAQEPGHFNEPGLFLVRPDQELYYAAIVNMPFGRPPLGELIGGMTFVLQNDYPARGNV